MGIVRFRKSMNRQHNEQTTQWTDNTMNRQHNDQKKKDNGTNNEWCSYIRYNRSA